MSLTRITSNDELADFDRQSFSFDGIEKNVYVSGVGPAVLVMSEMPGISPQVVRFSRWVRDAGLTVYIPSLFGQDGVTPSVDEALAVFKRTCISAEFRAIEEGGTSPVIRWLRQLAHHAHERCGGPGVGAVGMCFTGNFALSLMLEAPTIAPVVCQPSQPLDKPGAIGIGTRDLVAVRHRLEAEDLTVLAFRFAGDRWCTAQRFAAYSRALGPRFVNRVLPDSAAHPDPPAFFKQVVASPHSTVTAHLIDEEGQPTLAARDEIIRFLVSRLLKRPSD